MDEYATAAEEVATLDEFDWISWHSSAKLAEELRVFGEIDCALGRKALLELKRASLHTWNFAGKFAFHCLHEKNVIIILVCKNYYIQAIVGKEIRIRHTRSEKFANCSEL